ASTGPLTGARVAGGMQRLFGGERSYEIGPSDIGQLVALLRREPESRVNLTGTMGPPDFDAETGARHGQPSVYCLSSSGFEQNVMTYDERTGELLGSPSCVPGFVP